MTDNNPTMTLKLEVSYCISEILWNADIDSDGMTSTPLLTVEIPFDQDGDDPFRDVRSSLLSMAEAAKVFDRSNFFDAGRGHKANGGPDTTEMLEGQSFGGFQYGTPEFQVTVTSPENQTLHFIWSRQENLLLPFLWQEGYFDDDNTYEENSVINNYGEGNYPPEDDDDPYGEAGEHNG